MKRLALAAALMSVAAPLSAATVGEAVKADMPSLMALYQDLHANPELSMQEVRTPAKLAAEMKKLGFTVTEKVGKTGVVAVMKNGAGPTLMIRADMDGLPVVEQTGLPYARRFAPWPAAGWKPASCTPAATIRTWPASSVRHDNSRPARPTGRVRSS